MLRDVEKDVARGLPVRDTQTGRGTFWMLAVAAAVVFTTNPLAAGADVRWRSGSAPIARADGADLPQTITSLAERADARHIVVQFDQPISPKQRKELQRAGLDLHRYLGDHAFFATLSAANVNPRALGATRLIVGMRAVEREWKLAPAVLAENVPDWAVVGLDPIGDRTVGIYILFHPDVDLFTDATDVVEMHGAVVRDELESINGLVIELPLQNIGGLADEDAVQWIEWPLPRMSEVNNSNRVITEVNIVAAPPYDLDGTGVTVLIYDGNKARASHLDFEGRLTTGASDTSGVSHHATHVACTVGGGGVTDSTYTGMAPGVDLVSYGFQYDGTGTFLYTNPGDIESDYSDAISVYGADISNNSIGTNTENNGFSCAIQGDYGVTAQLIDTIVRGDGSNPLFTTPFRIVWANGNERTGSRCNVEGYGDYYSTAPPAGAKNHITIGALNSNDDSMTGFSSWGPVDDGRIKPDVSAPGCQSGGDGGVTSCSAMSDTSYTTYCGTSMAAPTVTGLLALLLEDFRDQFPAQPDPRNSTLKALLAHNAVDLGNAGPDYQYGYGSVRIKQTIDFMRTGNFLEDQVGYAETFTAWVIVDSSDTELKVTMAWDDFPGTPNVDPALVNDLDLRLFDPSQQQYYPWTLDPLDPGAPAVQTQADHVNNIEQVFVEDPVAGVWRIEVHGYTVASGGPQPFSLCASPELQVGCYSQGIVGFVGGTVSHACSDTATIKVVDCDLNQDSNAIDTVTVTITSDSEPAGESVLLSETGADTAIFLGAIPLEVTDSPGVLMVADGDTLTVTYIDADDGQGGYNIPLNVTAPIDCTPPVISNVQSTDLQLVSATVTLDTDEWATATVHYGAACGALTDSAIGTLYGTTHAIEVTGLQLSTTYFYEVEAADTLGNSTTDNNGGACYTFTTPDIPDYFTQRFYSGSVPNDLDGLSLTFEPDGSFGHYAGCTESVVSLPVDPSGGTALSMTDNSSITVTLTGGERVSLYGTTYGKFHVGSNGYITFWERAYAFRELLGYHFDQARISALFDDLDPSVAGTVSWKQLSDRAVVTWENVPEYGTTNSNTFQVEMRFDGTIVMSYLGLAAEDGLAGLSKGGGIPTGYVAYDLSAMEFCACNTNGIQDGDEDHIDCGGSTCQPCDCVLDSECYDTDYCNGVEACDAYGDCQPGTPVDCDDGVGCTNDYCWEMAETCYHLGFDANCDTDLYCYGTVWCDSVLDCQYADPLVDCDDGVDCTVDSCNEQTESCDNTPSNAFCSNGIYCDGAETCDALLGCQPGSEPCPPSECDEFFDVCTAQAYCDDDSHCDDGLFCTGVESCAGGACQAGSDPCPDQVCIEPADTCIDCLNDGHCDDGLFCNGVETCMSNVCVPGPDPCSPGPCDEAGDFCTCVSDSECDDDRYCNGVEACVSSNCVNGTAVDCDDGVGCTDDFCDEGTDSCVNPLNDASCDNGLFCDGAETCHATLDCQGGTAPNCDDGVPCTDDSCNEATDSCDNTPNDASCDNGIFCDGPETCEEGVGCIPAADPCPKQICNEATDTCDPCLSDGDCDDGLFCNSVETCVAGYCMAGSDPCPGQGCDEATDTCICIVDADCDDGLYCNGAETCDTGTCQAGTAVNCDDAVPCTDDSCNEGTDSCDNTPNDASCDNGIFCDGPETCQEQVGCIPATDPCPDQICNEATDTCDPCLSDGDCDDGLFCSGVETCVAGYCVAGNDPCPGQSCDEATETCTCIDDAGCDDGLFCNGVETCNTGTCQAGTAVNCDDAVPCTDDSCNEGTDSCDNTPNDANCADGVFCNGAETCSATLGCQAGSAPNCDDGVGCTDDSCNAATDSCDHLPNDANCPDDGVFCNGDEYCDAVNDCDSTGTPCGPRRPKCCPAQCVCATCQCSAQ